MQTGIYLEGSKSLVLAQIDIAASQEKKKYADYCANYQVFTGWGNIELRTDPQHEAKPISDKTSAALIDAAVANLKEQITDLDDNEYCSVSFQITVHRRNPK